MRGPSRRVVRLTEGLQRRPTRKLPPGKLDALPLALEIVAARGYSRLERSQRHVVQLRPILVALPAAQRAHVSLGLRTMRLEATPICDRADLLDRVADRHMPLVLGEWFDGVSAVELLTAMRARGWMWPVVVIGAGRDRLPAVSSTLGSVMVARDPVLHSSSATNPWLRHCVEAVHVQPRYCAPHRATQPLMSEA